jgi:hypothetical protein
MEFRLCSSEFLYREVLKDTAASIFRVDDDTNMHTEAGTTSYYIQGCITARVRT